jgi:hypothetical protein
MAKRFMLVDPSQPSTSKHHKTVVSTNWELCVLCQKDTGDALQCPGKNTKGTAGSGYESFTSNLHAFQELGCMPMEVDLQRLDNGSGILATLVANSAAWHKTCLLKFSRMKLERAMKANTVKDTLESPSQMVHTRRPSQDKLVEPTCFFCEKPAGQTKLHSATTFDIEHMSCKIPSF